MNDLDLLADLRSEVPLAVSDRVEHAVMTEITESPGHVRSGKRRRLTRSAGPVRAPRLSGRAWRPVLAGTLAVGVGVTAYGGVELSGSPSARQGTQTVAWSGRPTSPWPHADHPSYGRARTAAQLIADITRAAGEVPGRAPKPDEWVAVKQEYADSSGGQGGYLFGPPDKREISLTWFRGDQCAVASVPPVPAGTSPARTVTGKLTITTRGYYGPGCGGGTTLGGWKSVTYSYLKSLPSDPTALERILVDGAGPLGSLTREQAIFEGIDILLDAGESSGIVIPPKLSANLYRVLQQLPGVHFESAVDLAGRTGIGFSMILEGYLKEEIVIDPDTYTYMGFKDVAIKDHAMVATDGTRHVKKGHVMGWAALLGSAIVEQPGQLP